MRLRVLLFEDEPLVRSMLERLLQGRGCEVLPFADPGLCPLSSFATCQCPEGQACADIIISDIQMLTVQGLDFVESQLNKGCKCRHVALMSGEWSRRDRIRASQMGCQVFDKPFDLDEVYHWLDEVEREIDPERVLFTVLPPPGAPPQN